MIINCSDAHSVEIGSLFARFAFSNKLYNLPLTSGQGVDLGGPLLPNRDNDSFHKQWHIHLFLSESLKILSRGGLRFGRGVDILP